MSLQTRLSALITAIGADIKSIGLRVDRTLPDIARAYPSANTSITGWTLINCNTISFDLGGPNFALGKYTCPATGYYLINGCVATNTNSPAGTVLVLGAGVRHDPGGLWITGQSLPVAGSSSSGLQLVVSDIVYCTAGDTLQLGAYWQGGIAWQIAGNAPLATFLSVTLLRNAVR